MTLYPLTRPASCHTPTSHPFTVGPNLLVSSLLFGLALRYNLHISPPSQSNLNLASHNTCVFIPSISHFHCLSSLHFERTSLGRREEQQLHFCKGEYSIFFLIIVICFYFNRENIIFNKFSSSYFD